ncbi:MAG: hypothetical protein Q8R67_12225 [Rhodoferax sp.]|nr:hypothetical protein [Rhodoferax sp.]MDP3652439.1 hypothetical protein [Rhodoferax sp.]
MPLPIETLREQAAYWGDLDLTRMEAVDDIWAEYGMDAARLFLFGA